MVIESVDDAKEYMVKVDKTLIYLSELAKDAGLYKHASIFIGISAAFVSGPEDIDKVAELIHGYVSERIANKFNNY